MHGQNSNNSENEVIDHNKQGNVKYRRNNSIIIPVEIRLQMLFSHLPQMDESYFLFSLFFFEKKKERKCSCIRFLSGGAWPWFDLTPGPGAWNDSSKPQVSMKMWCIHHSEPAESNQAWHLRTTCCRATWRVQGSAESKNILQVLHRVREAANLRLIRCGPKLCWLDPPHPPKWLSIKELFAPSGHFVMQPPGRYLSPSTFVADRLKTPKFKLLCGETKTEAKSACFWYL